MQAQTLFYIIIAIIVFEFLLERILNILNNRNMKVELPARLKGYYNQEKYAKMQAYHKANDKVGLLSSGLVFVITLIFFYSNGFSILNDFLSKFTTSSYWLPILYLALLSFALSIISLPFSIYGNFVIEEKFGFNKMTFKTFVLDTLKGSVVSIILGGGLLLLFIWFYHIGGELFWVWAWIAFAAFIVFMSMFYTSLIVPLFNKLTPLEAGELRDKIERYAQSNDFILDNIYVINGSKRSSKANAYFSGLGSSKKIVLFDTLIENHTTDELVAVLAHEVGHYKKNHVINSLIISVLQMGITLFLLSLCLNLDIFSAALGVPDATLHIGLIAFFLLYSPVSLLTGIGMNMFSRKNEFEADSFSCQTSNGNDLKEALVKLSVNNLSNLEPHPAYVFIHYSHPPLLKRLAAIEKNITL